jgi:hypothetical protein
MAKESVVAKVLQDAEDEGKLSPEAESVLQDVMGTLYVGVSRSTVLLRHTLYYLTSCSWNRYSTSSVLIKHILLMAVGVFRRRSVLLDRSCLLWFSFQRFRRKPKQSLIIP